MKKLYSIIALLAISVVTYAQVIPGGDMETWRTGISGGSGTFPTRTIFAQYGWYGLDSLIIAEGEYISFSSFGLIGNGNNYHSQVFHDTTIVHGGTSSAKLITLKQDTIGMTGGEIANYITHFNIVGTSYSFSFSGGIPITIRMHSVSAWVQYKYRSGTIRDTAVLTVQALKRIGSVDSIIGTGHVYIDSTPGSTWQQVTAIMYYTNTDTIPDTMRVTIASSKSGSVDSSTLYVDDVTMTSIGLSVEKPIMTFEPVDIYPNPATNIINMGCNTSVPLLFELYAIGGQMVASKNIAGNDAIDVKNLPAGLYFYNIYDSTMDIVQKGKVSVVH